jgi:hypothetical protein
LDPNWIVTDADRHGMGVIFLCPCCSTSARPQYLGVYFANPLDGGSPAPAAALPAPRWQRTGETFETLSVTPSVDASNSGHWHGYITNGEIR